VNNWLTHLEIDWENPVWRHWLDAFVQRHTLIRHDPRGSGLSDRNATNFSLDGLGGRPRSGRRCCPPAPVFVFQHWLALAR
jgi:hypothetical protein